MDPNNQIRAQGSLIAGPTSVGGKTWKEISQKNQNPNQDEENERQGDCSNHQLLHFDHEIRHLRCHNRRRHRYRRLDSEISSSAPRRWRIWRRWQRRRTRRRHPPSMFIYLAEFVRELQFADWSPESVPNPPPHQLRVFGIQKIVNRKADDSAAIRRD